MSKRSNANVPRLLAEIVIPLLRQAQRRLNTSLHNAFRYMLKNESSDIEMQDTDEEDIE